MQLTTDGVPGNIFWSADKRVRILFSGDRPSCRWHSTAARRSPGSPILPGRSPSVSRDGTRIVYLSRRCRDGRRRSRRARTRGSGGRGTLCPTRRTAAADRDSHALARGRHRHARRDGSRATCGRELDQRQAAGAVGAGAAARQSVSEQTPDYSGAKIIYTITERTQGLAGRQLRAAGRRRYTQ